VYHWKWLSAVLLGALIAEMSSAYAQQGENAVSEWQHGISRRLVSEKRFPNEARGQSGTARVIFTIDRSGNLVAEAMLESTGFPLLDAEAMALVERAQPFPPPPPEVTDDNLTMAVPIIFLKGPPPSAIDLRNEEAIVKGEGAVNAKMRGLCRGC
jgi:periplasmic protein TonB